MPKERGNRGDELRRQAETRLKEQPADPEALQGLVHELTDITTRKQTEESLRQVRDGLERMVEERTIELEPGAGTRITAELPLQQGKNQPR